MAVSLASLALLVAGSAPATATHAWGNYHWSRAANPFNVALGDNLTPDWDGYLVTASGDWSQSTVLDTSIQPGSTTGKRCR
ncbi:MAG TPA: hypothetical protein VFV20_00145, partial [Candidatus Limnocylindria bacterium]|nr:hypothetical protein [Candidatus Limnocylindria bacterium]